jgi:ribonucleoside-triphosphate reductase
MALEQIQKRSGDIVSFDKQKITGAIFNAAASVGGQDREQAQRLTENVVNVLNQRFQNTIPTV